MKRIIYSLLVLSAITGSVGCKKFLDKVPTDFVSPENYFKNETDVMTSLAGVYDVLGKTNTYSRTLIFENDISDEGFNSLSSTPIDLSFNNYDATHVGINGMWNLFYQGINRANMFLANIDKPELVMDAAKRDAAKGEVLFLRGYYYFMLASNWGDVPLRIKPTANASDVNVARTPVAKVFEQIVKDMEEAAGLVQPSTAYAFNSRITKSTVWGILARVNLKWAGEPVKNTERFAESRKWALKVMEPANGHVLNPDYKQIFINHAADKYDPKECLWEVEFNKSLTGGQEEEGAIGSITGIPNSDRNFGYSYGALHVQAKYYNSFETGDLRRDWTINPFYYGTVGGVANSRINYSAAQIYNRCNAKWRREYETALPKNVNTTPINFPLLRYADVLLMFAEAENEVNGPTADAYAAINAVRKRAFGLTLPTPPDPAAVYELTAGLDESEFRAAVYNERSHELGFEALRKFDLIRWGIYITTMNVLGAEVNATAPAEWKAKASLAGVNAAQRHLLLPIPSAEMALNKAIIQNPEW